MARKLDDMTQHVARRVRVTRMFLKLSIEEASALLDIPVWLLSYKENGLLNFSYKDFVDMERLYKLSWPVFFQDYSSKNELESKCNSLVDNAEIPFEAYANSDAITNYLAIANAELADAYVQQENARHNPHTMAAIKREPAPVAHLWDCATDALRARPSLSKARG